MGSSRSDVRADPLGILATALASGESPPLAWAIEYAPDGDLNAAVARLWPRCNVPEAMLYLLCRAAARGIAPPAVWEYALDAVSDGRFYTYDAQEHPDAEWPFWEELCRRGLYQPGFGCYARQISDVAVAPRVTP